MGRLAIEADADEFRRMWADGETCAAIGERFGASGGWASQRAARLGLPPRKTPGGVLPARAMELAYAHGASLRRIRRELRAAWPNLSITMVRRALSQRGVRIRGRAARGVA